jgi:cytochrome c oxidase subunit II
MRVRTFLTLLTIALLLGACQYQHYQSDFGGAAVEGRQFLTLLWIFVGVCVFMYALVILFLAAAILRRRRPGEANVVETGLHHHSHPMMRSILVGWSALIGIGLAGLAIASFFADRSMAKAAANEKLSITLTGNQWWWDITYDSSDPSKTLRTANELHLPVGVPARILLRSNDVIHSFWVPSLAGKQDLIPGRENDITIVPTKTGIYRGPCAEFCGLQHAHMSLVVVVDSYSEFIKWWNHQLEPAPAPTSPLALAGREYVTKGPCSSCHNIAGTTASGTIGPDLTHLASRKSLAAGTMPMNEGNLYGWVEDPQSLKPGVLMPTIGIEPDQLHAVVAYLGTLR